MAICPLTVWCNRCKFRMYLCMQIYTVILSILSVDFYCERYQLLRKNSALFEFIWFCYHFYFLIFNFHFLLEFFFLWELLWASIVPDSLWKNNVLISNWNLITIPFQCSLISSFVSHGAICLESGTQVKIVIQMS